MRLTYLWLNPKALPRKVTWSLMILRNPNLLAKKLKGIEGATQTSAVVSLCDLKSTPAKTSSKPGPKKKGKEEKEPPNKGKNGMSKDSLGDMVVVEIVVIGCDTIIRCYGRLAKNRKKLQVRDLDTEEELSYNKDNRVEEVLEGEEGEKTKGPSTILDKGKTQKEVSASHSSEPLEIEHNDLDYTMGGDEELSVLKERMEKMDKKFNGLTHFTVKLVHCVTSTLSAVMKDEMEMKKVKTIRSGSSMIWFNFCLRTGRTPTSLLLVYVLLVCVCFVTF